MRDGLCVQGQVMKNPRGRGMVLDAERVCSPALLLAPGAGYAANVAITDDASRAPLILISTQPAASAVNRVE